MKTYPVRLTENELLTIINAIDYQYQVDGSVSQSQWETMFRLKKELWEHYESIKGLRVCK